jgi:hypothetical protein
MSRVSCDRICDCSKRSYFSFLLVAREKSCIQRSTKQAFENSRFYSMPTKWNIPLKISGIFQYSTYSRPFIVRSVIVVLSSSSLVRPCPSTISLCIVLFLNHNPGQQWRPPVRGAGYEPRVLATREPRVFHARRTC